MRQVVKSVVIVVQVNVDSMELHRKLYEQMAEKLMYVNISFIVMSKRTAELLMMEITFTPPYELKSFNGYEVLISESLRFGEFRIG